MNINLEEMRKEYSRTYDKGLVNHLIRSWFYLKRGLDTVNDFKYLVAGILAFYIALKLENRLMLIVIFLVAIPILTAIGFIYTHKMAKPIEWTNMMFGSYFARYSVDLTERNAENIERTAKVLEEIRDELRKNNQTK